MSLSATPKKRRKTTWTALLSDVETSLIPDDINLEQLLSEDEDAEVFVLYSERNKRLILNDLLEGRPELVDAIIQSVEVATVPLATLIKNGHLAPSKVPADDIILVANLILAHSGMSEMLVLKEKIISELPSLLPADYVQQPLTTTEHTLNETVIRMLAEHAKRTRGVHTTECASYTMLGTLCVHFASTLSAVFQKEFVYVNQFRVTKTSKSGPPPQTVALVLDEGDCSPRILYECKTSIPHYPGQIADGDLIETLLQGYYCLKYYKLNRLMVCLTDLTVWHYMLIENSVEKMKITHHDQWIGLTSSTYDGDTLLKHSKFVIEVEKYLDPEQV